MSIPEPAVTFRPLSPQEWPDLQQMFESAESDAAGNPRGCWCMEWRLPRQQWKAQAGPANRAAMKALVDSGSTPGIVAYSDEVPVGWCSVSPRRALAGIQEAGAFPDFDDPDVWSIVCFYLIPEHRGRGMMTRLVYAATDYAGRHGARIVEAYPVDLTVPGAMNTTGFMGIRSVFLRAGFVDASHDSGVLALGAYTAGNRTMRYHINVACHGR